MTGPFNTVYEDGGAPITADGLNTFVQTAFTMSDLRAFVGQTGMQVIVQGTAAAADGGQGTFYWNAGSTAADDNGVTTVVPNGSATGAWTRLPNVVAPGTAVIGGPSSPVGTTTLAPAGVMMGAPTAFTPTKSGRFLFVATFNVENNAPPNGATIWLQYGNGTAPSNGAPLQGTQIAFNQPSVMPDGVKLAGALTGIVTGLTVGVAYWVELALAAQGGGTAALTDVFVAVVEL